MNYQALIETKISSFEMSEQIIKKLRSVEIVKVKDLIKYSKIKLFVLLEFNELQGMEIEQLLADLGLTLK